MCHTEKTAVDGRSGGTSDGLKFYAPEFWKEMDGDILALAYREAAKKLESQFDAYKQITRVSSVFLGWMVGGFISLSAAIVILWPGGWGISLIMSVYVWVALIAPSLIIVFGIQFGQVNYDPGVEPNGLLFGGMCDFLLKQDREHRSRAFRVAALKNMQDWIDANRVWNDRRIDRHHLAVRIFAGELIAGVVLFCVLAAVL